MKKNLLLALLSLLPFYLFSQSYDPMLVEGNRWDTSCWLGMGVTYKSSDVICGQETLNDTTYDIHLSYATDNDFVIQYIQSDTAYLREDTLTGEIYRKDNKSSPERLIIDYGMEVGDSIFLQGYYFIADSIGMEYVFDKMRKAVYLGGGATFIEGFGIWPYGIIERQCGFTLHNFSNDSQACNLETGVEDAYQIAELEVYPNPVVDYLTVPLLDTFYDKKAKIYNIEGQLILETMYDSEINVEALPKGLYILIVDKYVSKFVKM